MVLSRLKQIHEFPKAIPQYKVEPGTYVRCVHWEIHPRLLKSDVVSEVVVVGLNQLSAPGCKKVLVIPTQFKVREGKLGYE